MIRWSQVLSNSSVSHPVLYADSNPSFSSKLNTRNRRRNAASRSSLLSANRNWYTPRAKAGCEAEELAGGKSPTTPIALLVFGVVSGCSCTIRMVRFDNRWGLLHLIQTCPKSYSDYLVGPNGETETFYRALTPNSRQRIPALSSVKRR